MSKYHRGFFSERERERETCRGLLPSTGQVLYLHLPVYRVGERRGHIPAVRTAHDLSSSSVPSSNPPPAAVCGQ